jgi:hypothetical protein
MNRHERMAKYLKELSEYRERYQRSHGPLILKELDKEITRVQHWLLNPTHQQPYTYLGFHVNPYKDSNLKRGSYNRVMTNRHINN